MMAGRPGKGTFRPAFTVAELLISLVITSLVGACIAMMVNGVAMGTDAEHDGRRHLARAQSLQARLSQTIHSCECVLAAGNGYIVYWVADANNNKKVEMTELGMIELNGTDLVDYRMALPIGMTDQAYKYFEDWRAAAVSAKATYFKPYQTLGRNVTAFNVTVDVAGGSSAANARLVTCHFTLNDGVTQRSGSVTAALRNPTKP